MTEQWKELKETIIELRDNDGTGTQQEVCKFLANLMDVLEKQMQEPCEDCISRQAAKKIIFNEFEGCPTDEEVTHLKRLTRQFDELPSVTPAEPKTGRWIYDKNLYSLYKCTACNGLCTIAGWASCIPEEQMYKAFKYCPNCGAKMESEAEE